MRKFFFKLIQIKSLISVACRVKIQEKHVYDNMQINVIYLAAFLPLSKRICANWGETKAFSWKKGWS